MGPSRFQTTGSSSTVCSGPLAGLVAAPVHPLGLQRAEEALAHRVVPAVPFAAHATLDVAGPKQLLERAAGVLQAWVHTYVISPA